MIDAETGDAFRLRETSGDLAVSDITCSVRDPYSKGTELTATLGNGKVSVLDAAGQDPIGMIQVDFTRDDMRGLCAKTYEIGCTVTNVDGTVQPLLDTVAIKDGVVV